MLDLRFSFPEILSLIGLVQCVYLLVFIVFRTGVISGAFLPSLYFLILGSAFFLDFAQIHIGEIIEHYYLLQWAAWFLGPPISVLLVIQFAQTTKSPDIKDYWVILLLPLCLLLSVLATNASQSCAFLEPCHEFKALLRVTGLMAGAISLLVIFSKKDLFLAARKQKFGQERYWLILALIFMNIIFLAAMLAHLTNIISEAETTLLRTIFGLGFVYLVSTSLLRLYPKSSKFAKNELSEDLSAEEQVLAKKIESLMELEKVYQEPTYSRSDLAKECNISETVISRVINNHFQKSFPKLINQYRVEDAKQLLKETKAPVKVIGEEVGFNSLPSFNRVFKDESGLSPSAYRKSLKT